MTSNDKLTPSERDAKGISNAENKFISRARQAVSENAQLALKFGAEQGMSCVLVLAQILELTYNKHAFDSLLLHYAVKDDDFKDEVWSHTYSKPRV